MKEDLKLYIPRSTSNRKGIRPVTAKPLNTRNIRRFSETQGPNELKKALKPNNLESGKH